jgi:molybdopterin converting factor small subunit
MSITLLIPTALRAFTDRRPEVRVEGRTVAEALAAFSEACPDIKPHLYDEAGELRPFVNIYLGDRNIKTIGGLDTVLSEGDTLMLVPAIAGGRGEGA